MIYNQITAGKSNEPNVIIEIVPNSPVKYEFDKDVQSLRVDRVMSSTMSYPCHYGFVPKTLGGDGDPVDVLVHTHYPLMPMSLIKVKPIGVLITEDESGLDEKILAVPTKKIDPFYANINSYKELPDIFLKKIEHFFERYKDLEKNKWVKVKEWMDTDEAIKVIEKGINAYKA